MADANLTRAGLSCGLSTNDGIFDLRIGPANLRGRVQAKAGNREIVGQRVIETSPFSVEDAHGRGEGFRARLGSDQLELELLLEALIYDDYPFIALRAGLVNSGSTILRTVSLSPFTSDSVDYGTGTLDGWVNGYHSWSFTGFVPHQQKQPRQWPHRLLSPHSINTATPNPKQAGQYVGEWVGALVDGDRGALLAGFSGVERLFGQVRLDGRPERKSLRLENTLDGIPLPPGETIWGEWALLYAVNLPHPDPLGIYAEATARLTPPRWPEPHPMPGWSSWYQFFADVTLEDMERNQAALKDLRPRLPLKLIQLDDGYQPHWGDWLAHNEKFPGGVKAWAESVRADGFEPGLWLSPYTIDPGSRIAKEHPEAILRDERGRIVHGGFLINRWIKGLDPTHPVTQGFVKETIHTIVHEWGIKYLKLDFLYCGALPGVRYDPTKARAEALREGFKLIRETAGDDVMILGCGCPLGPALGIFDMMRVSPDVAPHFYPDVFGLKRPFKNDYSLPSARNSLSISLQRGWQHRRWWWLDADNLLVRAQQELTEAEIQTLTTVIGMTSSHLIVSDELPKISAERADWAAVLLPPLTGRIETPTMLSETNPAQLIRRYSSAGDEVVLVALINWADEPRPLTLQLSAIGLPPGLPVIVSDFWEKGVNVAVEDKLSWEAVPAHGVKLLALRPLRQRNQLAGSDLHFSMGAEVLDWVENVEGIGFRIALDRQAAGRIILRLMRPPEDAFVDGEEAPITSLGADQLYELPVRVEGNALVRVNFR